jgi:hypothetical protein
MWCKNYDLQIIQGTDFLVNIAITDDFGNPFNLSGCSLESYVKMSYGSTGFYNLNPTFTLAVSGQLTMGMTNSETSGIPVGIGFYDLNLISQSNTIIKPLKGFVYVSPQITY